MIGGTTHTANTSRLNCDYLKVNRDEEEEEEKEEEEEEEEDEEEEDEEDDDEEEEAQNRTGVTRPVGPPYL